LVIGRKLDPFACASFNIEKLFSIFLSFVGYKYIIHNLKFRVHLFRVTSFVSYYVSILSFTQLLKK